LKKNIEGKFRMKKEIKKIRLFLTLIFIVISAFIFALENIKDPIVISGTASSTEVFIGDHFIYDLKIEWNEGYEIIQVEPPMEMAQFELLEINPTTESTRDNLRHSKTWSFTLSTYTVGNFKIPSFKITYKTPHKEEISIQTQTIDISVKSILLTADDTHDIRAMKNSMDIAPKPYLRNFLIFLGLILILILLISLYIVKRIITRRNKVPEIWIPPRPIEILAMEDLEKLKNSTLIADGKIKEYYSSASEIIRIYLGRRFNFTAIDMTSFEIIRILEEKKTGKQTMEILESFFERCDLVKFAKNIPSAKGHILTLEEAEIIINETTQKNIPIEKITPENDEAANEVYKKIPVKEGVE
jgi:oxygen tolerance protein BatD